jgi:integrase
MAGNAMTKISLPYVHEYRDRHGKARRYVRRPGLPRVPLPGTPGSADFMAAYQAALAEPSKVPRSKHGLGTFGFLVTDYYRSPEFTNLRPNSQRVYRLVLDGLVEKHGHRLVRDLEPNKARAIIHAVGPTRPGMANLTISVLKKLMTFAIKIGLRESNPIIGLERYRQGSHHTWTEEELAAYEARWPLGTRERLAFSLLLFTGQRVGDVSRLKRSDIVGGMIKLVQEKTGAPLAIPVHPALERAMRAGPSNGVYLVGDRHGRPIAAASLSGVVKRAAATAGLPDRCKPHGLRKAILRRLAEHGATAKQIAAVSGHKTLAEVERYTQAADQAKLSKAAVDLLPDEG